MEKYRREGWVDISTKRWNWFIETGSRSETGSLFQRWGEAYWKEWSVIFREEAVGDEQVWQHQRNEYYC